MSLLSKTYDPGDFRQPAVAETARKLRRYALQLGLGGIPFGVNGILKRRFWVRKHKLWEYARGIAGLEEQGIVFPGHGQPAPRVLDFGGAATLPIFYLAAIGFEVLCLDIDAALGDHTNRVAQKRAWKLHASQHNLVTTPAPAGWGQFDAVISFSVLEHIPKAEQAPLLAKLSALLKPGGMFALTFDFGADAPQPDAVRSLEEVAHLVSATGLEYVGGQPLLDTGERFVLDKRHAKQKFTFASVFLHKKK